MLNSLKGYKTITAAALAIVTRYVSSKYGIEIPEDIQFYGLVVAMIVLRLITTTPAFNKPE